MFLELNPASMRAGRPVTINFDLFVVDQREGGQDKHKSVTHEFTASSANWGFSKFFPLEQLASADRAYLKDDRLVVRVDISVSAAARGAAA